MFFKERILLERSAACLRQAALLKSPFAKVAIGFKRQKVTRKMPHSPPSNLNDI